MCSVIIKKKKGRPKLLYNEKSKSLCMHSGKRKWKKEKCKLCCNDKIKEFAVTDLDAFCKCESNHRKFCV